MRHTEIVIFLSTFLGGCLAVQCLGLAFGRVVWEFRSHSCVGHRGDWGCEWGHPKGGELRAYGISEQPGA